MTHWKILAIAMGVGLVCGLAVGALTAPPPAGAAMRELAPGLWRAEVGDFSRLMAAVAFDANDVWAAGDGIVHFDGSGWKQTLPGRRPFFRAIDGLSSRDLWAAGVVDADYCDTYGMMYHYDGTVWRPEAVETSTPLYGLDVVSDTDGWAVGGWDNAVIVRYDGTAWRLQPAPEVAGLRAVQALAPDNVWAVGDKGAIAHFDGQVWRAVTGPRFTYLTDLHFLHRDFGWAVGFEPDTGTGVILAYRDGAWALDCFDETPPLYGVRALAPTVSVAVGHFGVIMYHDGQEWREVGRTNPGGAGPWYPGGALAAGEAEAKVVATGSDAVGRAERIDRTEDLGQPSAVDLADGPLGGGGPSPREEWSEALNSLVTLPDRESMIAVGYAGQVVRIDDLGRWTELHSGHNLYGIDMLDATYGWVVGSGGRPLRWDGTAWTVPPAPGASRWLVDVDVVARDDVWAVGRRGTVLHWNGQAWANWPRFTWLGFQAVAFSGPRDGWAVSVASVEDEDVPSWEAATETLIFHWDGQAWQQAIRLCDTAIMDVAALGPGDAWFADPNHARVLRYDGQGWSWQPIWGDPRPDGPATRVVRFAVAPDGTVWGSAGYYGALSRLEGGIWRTLAGWESPGYVGDIAGASADGLWGLTYDNRLVYIHQGKVAPVLELPQDMGWLSVVAGPDGTAEVWMIGPATTVLRYRAPATLQPVPLATATPVLPPPLIHPTPTPYSTFDRSEAWRRILALVDPDGTGEVRLDTLRLETLATWEHERRDWLPIREYSGDWPWFSYGNGSLDPCERSPGLPVWVAELSAAPHCPSHEVVVLDATGRDAWYVMCYPRRLATLHLPMVLRPRTGQEPGPMPTAPTVTPVGRDLTPVPVVDIQGACPTSTPRPEDPWPYPGPAVRGNR